MTLVRGHECIWILERGREAGRQASALLSWGAHPSAEGYQTKCQTALLARDVPCATTPGAALTTSQPVEAPDFTAPPVTLAAVEALSATASVPLAAVCATTAVPLAMPDPAARMPPARAVGAKERNDAAQIPRIIKRSLMFGLLENVKFVAACPGQASISLLTLTWMLAEGGEVGLFLVAGKFVLPSDLLPVRVSMTRIEFAHSFP